MLTLFISLISIISIDSYYGRSLDSAVGIATGYVLDDRGVEVRVPEGSRILSTPRRPVWLRGPPNPQWVPGALSLGLKRQGREADHSPPTSAKVKTMWIYTSTPHTPSWRSA
jgi:hypothetical protein